MGRTIALATLVAGALDILFAICLSLYFGRNPMDMLRYVASGPFPPAVDMGVAGSALGLLTHFALMGLMVTAYMFAARQWPVMLRRPLVWGLAYAAITYVWMNLIVVPIRFDTPLPPRPISIATQSFAHIFLVGLPIAFIAARNIRARSIA
jgi:hypothetical protein